MELAEGTRRVAEGDLTYTITVAAENELKTLVNSFNKMTMELRENRTKLEQSAKRLFEQNIEIEEKRRYIEIVLNNVSAGVISLDSRGLITTINASAERMLKINAADLLKKSFTHLPMDQYPDLPEEIIERFNKKKEETIAKTLSLVIGNEKKTFKVTFNALKDEAGRQLGIVMVFDDVTELEKAQRMAAWREVARRIAHEVKNPLTPISLSAQRLKRKYHDKIQDPVFYDCIQTIIDHTDLIRNLVNEFSAFARFPAANPAPQDLLPIVTETISLFKEGNPGIEFRTDIPGDLPELSLDKRQIKQVFINLFDNALAAMGESGSITVSARILNDGKTARIEVADTGPGIPDDKKPNLFEPDFTTKPSGMGLGLAIVHSIVHEHGGRIFVQDNQPTGAIFVILLPVAA